jgi:hypothetical protein
LKLSYVFLDLQVMVWKTNFDRHLEDFILTQVHRGDTQLQHLTQTFPQPPNTASHNSSIPQKSQLALQASSAHASQGQPLDSGKTQMQTASSTESHVHASLKVGAAHASTHEVPLDPVGGALCKV